MIRKMKESDLEKVISLSNQLGYKIEIHDLINRFKIVSQREHDLLLVATISNTKNVGGWIHLQIRQDILTSQKGEIKAFVVDESYRNMGIGKNLLLEGEAWLKTKGIHTICLSTNVSRTDAHRFYLKENFKLLKTGHMFQKEIGSN